MPHIADIKSLESAADLMRDTHALYDSVLAHIRDEHQHDAMRGVTAVRGALHLRLRDHLAELGHAGARPAPPGQTDVACLGIYRQLSQGDSAGALRALAAWDDRLRDQIAERLLDTALTATARAHLRFTVDMLDAMPVAPGPDAAPTPLRQHG